MSIATTLVQAMEQTGISQCQLAEQVGVTQSYISQICTGKKIPTISVLTRIGEIFGLSVQEFLRDGDVQQLLVPTSDEAHILTLYRSMSKHDQAIVCGVVEQLYAMQKPRASHRSRNSLSV